MDRRECRVCGARFEPKRAASSLCGRKACELKSGPPCVECGKPSRARGLCATHYNQRHQPDRHRKGAVPCTLCGKACQKEPSKRRPFCSYQCRDDWRVDLYDWTRPIPWRRCPGPGCRVRWYDRTRVGMRYCPSCVESKNYVQADLRSPLRRALESSDGPGVIAAVRADCRVDGDGCWIWRRRTRDGYANVNVAGQTMQVHRLVLESVVGPLGEQAAHHVCAKTACVNPDHLQPVTAAANTAEMLARRYLVGRIQQLESVLAELCPDHPALEEVSISRMPEVA